MSPLFSQHPRPPAKDPELFNENCGIIASDLALVSAVVPTFVQLFEELTAAVGMDVSNTCVYSCISHPLPLFHKGS